MKRSKKILSAAVVGALAAAQMAMPAMAAGGKMEVNVDTMTAVIRVVVPTSMQIAVNQFQMNDAGSQIYSTDFKMENKSEIPVKVTVASKADLKNTTKLLETKEAVEEGKTGEVWMAVAAKTAPTSYADGSATAIGDLDETGVLLCRHFNAQTFINAIGGNGLYSKEFFAQNGIDLYFLRMDDISYSQYWPGFVPSLSIIDVMMRNKVNDIRLLLERYQLE